MITKRDVQLGKIALRVGMVSKEQLAKSIAIQKKLDKKVGLGAIWLKKGFVNKDQLEEIVKIHNTEKGGENGTSGKKKKKKKKPAEAGSEAAASETTASEAGSESEAPASASELGSVAGASDEASAKKDEASSAEAPAPEKKTSKTSAALKKDETSSAEAPAEKKTSKTAAALKKDEASSAEAPAEKKASKTSAALKKDDGKKDEPSSEEASTDRKSSKTSAALAKDEKKKTGKFDKKPRDASNDSEVDAALFESVMSDEGSVDEGDASRRVIACSECKKKYRVKKKQAGKRFSCRNCGEKVRVPADLFERPAKGGKADKAKAKKGDAGVEEFSLSGHAEEDSDEGSAAPTKTEKPPSGKNSAREAPAKEPGKSGPQKNAGGKSGASPGVAAGGAKDPMSIAELAKAAEKRVAQPLGPRMSSKKLAGLYIQAALLILVAFGIGGGIWYWNYSNEQARIAAHNAEVMSERARFQEPYDAGIKAAHDALEKVKTAAPSADLLSELTTAISQLEVGRLPVLVMLPTKDGKPIERAPAINIQQPENSAFAIKHDQDVKAEDLSRDLVLAHGRVQLALGGQKFLGDAVRDFQSVIDLDKKNPDAEAQALIGQAEVLRRNYKVAIENLKRSQASKPSPRTKAWLALAYEAGDISGEAVAAYEALAASEPLAKVLKARALLANGDLDNSLSEATDAAGKLGADGEPLAAAHAIRGLVLERKGDEAGSDKAFDACVAAGGESGRGFVARGEHRLRMGRFPDAAKDFESAIKTAGGARAALGLGDAKAGVLEVDAARTARIQATTLAVKHSAALLLGEIDAFDDPRSADPRSASFRRLGDAAFALGRLDDARASYMQAIQTDAYDPEAFAGLAGIEVAQKDESSAEGHARQARTLLFSANEKPSPNDDPPLVRGAVTARVLMIEAVVWRARGNLGAAEKSINGALAADALAAGAFAYSLKGRILQDRNDNNGAKNEYLKALDVEESGKDLATTLYQQAKAEFANAVKTQDPASLAKTHAALDGALTLAPNHAHALALRGRLAILEKKWRDALGSLSAAIELNPFFRDAYVARGFLYIRDLPDELRGDQAAAKATTDFGFVFKIDEGTGEQKADVYFGRALCEWDQGDTNHALDDLKKTIDLAPRWAAPYGVREKIHRKNSRDAEADADKKKFEELKKSGEEPK